MKKFIKQIRKISEKIYDEIGGIDEDSIQVALSVEFDKCKINYLRETNIQLFYESHPLRLFELDFLIYPSPSWDLKESIITEIKLQSKLNDEHRQQLKNYLKSAPLNSLKEVKKISKGLLINFKKLEKYKDGTNEPPDDKIEIEIWEFKNKRFKKIHL